MTKVYLAVLHQNGRIESIRAFPDPDQAQAALADWVDMPALIERAGLRWPHESPERIEWLLAHHLIDEGDKAQSCVWGVDVEDERSS
jgi:hypothetical protein